MHILSPGRPDSFKSGFFCGTKINACIGGFLFVSGPVSAYTQQLIPVIRQVNTSSAASEWNAFLRIETFAGTSYVSLAQVAALFDGTLHWHPVAKQVDFTLRGHDVRFLYDSNRAWIDGQPKHLEQRSVKDTTGFWVPASFFATDAFYLHTRMKLNWPPPAPKRAAPEVGARPLRVAPARERPGSTKDLVITPTSVPTATAPRERHARNAIQRVVIDPGHGGKDPGAVSAHGVEEKAVNLAVSLELAEALREKQGYEVLLTRMDDTFIPLEDRAKLANRFNADLFISIHCNASLSPKLKGFEVYFLSERASDPHADSVARLENASLALEGKKLPTPRQVEALLRSLVKNSNINESSALGSLVDHQVSKRLSEPTLGIKQAGFYVLRGAEMPAVLIETAFLSNPSEEKRLQETSFRGKLVEGIVAAVNEYDERKQKVRHMAL